MTPRTQQEHRAAMDALEKVHDQRRAELDAAARGLDGLSRDSGLGPWRRYLTAYNAWVLSGTWRA